jgi:hypothetical protein
LTIVGLIAFLPIVVSFALDYPYGLAGTGLFVVIGVIFGRIIPHRLRWVMGISAGAALLLVVTLHFASEYRLIVENRSGQTVKQVQIYCETGRDSTFDLEGRLPSGRTIDTTFHALGFNGKVSVQGRLADGTVFDSSSRQFQSNGDYRRTHITITAGGNISMVQD